MVFRILMYAQTGIMMFIGEETRPAMPGALEDRRMRHQEVNVV